MNIEPLVSIIAINYNCARFVTETLDSIKAQSYQNIELIIVDDCSTDNSVGIIRKWLETFDKPYKLIIHETNKGVCATCNDGIKNSNGKYISLTATDDLLMSEKIQVQVELLEKSEDDVCAVYSDAFLIKEDSSPRYGWFIQRNRDFSDLPHGYIYDELIEGNFLPAMSLLIKSECYKAVGYFDEQLAYEDYDMWLRLAKNYKFILSDYISVKYRVRNGSLVASIKNWLPSLARIYAKHLDDPRMMRKMEDLAKNSYTGKNAETLAVFKELQVNNSFIKKVLLFSRLNIPISVGFRILDRIRRN